MKLLLAATALVLCGCATKPWSDMTYGERVRDGLLWEGFIQGIGKLAK